VRLSSATAVLQVPKGVGAFAPPHWALGTPCSALNYDRVVTAVAEHRGYAPGSVPCFILTVSDSRTLETDTSGRAIAALLEDAGHRVEGREVVPDEPHQVLDAVRRRLDDGRARAVITTGGTGFAKRDTTFEALGTLFEKTIVGFGELFRVLSYEQVGAAAMLSRATAGIAGRTAIFLLPGSEDAVRLAMSKLILPELGHLIGQLDRHPASGS